MQVYRKFVATSRVLLISLTLLLLCVSSVLAQIQIDSYILVDAPSGQTVNDYVDVYNPTDEPITLEVWVEDWTTTIRGDRITKKSLGKAGVLDRSLAPYLTLKSPTRFKVPSHETRKFYFSTQLPEGKRGSYWTGIVFAQEAPMVQQDGEANLRARLAFFAKVIRFDNSRLEPWVSFVSKPEIRDNRLYFTITVENKGSLAFFVPITLTIYEGLHVDDWKKGTLEIGRVKGQELVATIPPFYFMPGQQFDLQISVPKPPTGVYTAKAKICIQKGEYAPVGLREFRVGR